MKKIEVIFIVAMVCSLAGGFLSTRALAEEDEAIEKKEPIDRCVACHVEEDVMPEGHNDADIHMQPGLSCAGCHGGDPTSDDEDVAMSEDAGFVGAPEHEQITAFCGRCHSDIGVMRAYQPRIPTDQVSQYETSKHGQLLARGDRKVAVCTSCHTSHAIMSAKDIRSTVHPFSVPATCSKCHGDAEYMAGYDIPTDQHERFATSVHGTALLDNQDIGAPACNDCHGNHGAMPPGITSVRQVCGHCHVNNAKYFSESTMGRAFAEQKLHGCEECHGNHGVKRASDAMVGVHKGAVCIECHENGDKGYAAAREINSHLRALVASYETAIERQKVVHRKGMDDEEIAYLLQESHQSLIQSRTLVHTFDPKQVRAKTDEGLAKSEEAIELAAIQVQESKTRRRGFGFATLFTTILVIALFLKIRNMEST